MSKAPNQTVLITMKIKNVLIVM